MKKILVCLLLLTKIAIGQTDSTESQIPNVSYLKGSGGIILGAHFIGTTITGELGYIKSNVTKVKDYIGFKNSNDYKLQFWATQPYSAVTIGSEFFSTGSNDFYVGPKIGFDYNLLVLHARINLTYYTDFKSAKDFRVSPALGLSLGFVNIMYNFNYPLLKNRFDNISTNRISFILFLANKQ